MSTLPQVSYASLLPIDGFLGDLSARVGFFRTWADSETFSPPEKFWVGGFFFPQSFLTSLLMDFSRRRSVSVNEVGFRFRPLKEAKGSEGSVLIGFKLEGARWNMKKGVLDEAKAKVS